MVWEKGQSGNTGGRPKNLEYIKRLAQEHCPKAIETLAKNLDSEDERVQVAAATVLLDRGYGKAQQIVEVKKENPFADMSAEDVIALRERIRALGQSSGLRVEVPQIGTLQTLQKAT